MSTTAKVREICNAFTDAGCGKTCPLAKACEFHAGDAKAIWAERMNSKAEQVVWPIEEMKAA